MRRIVLIALSLALPFLSSACSDSTGGAAPITGSSGESTGSSSNEVRVEDIDPAALLESRPFDSTALGALHGVIQVRGKVPKRFPIGARKVKDCCAFESVDHMSDIILVRDGKLENAYVTVIAGYERDEIPPASSDPVFMDQKGCIYTPHVTGMQVGQKLLVGTSDPTIHNVNVSAPRNQSRNNAMVQGQAPLEYEFQRPDTVHLRCDIHPVDVRLGSCVRTSLVRGLRRGRGVLDPRPASRAVRDRGSARGVRDLAGQRYHRAKSVDRRDFRV